MGSQVRSTADGRWYDPSRDLTVLAPKLLSRAIHATFDKLSDEEQKDWERQGVTEDVAVKAVVELRDILKESCAGTITAEQITARLSALPPVFRDRLGAALLCVMLFIFRRMADEVHPIAPEDKPIDLAEVNEAVTAMTMLSQRPPRAAELAAVRKLREAVLSAQQCAASAPADVFDKLFSKNLEALTFADQIFKLGAK